MDGFLLLLRMHCTLFPADASSAIPARQNQGIRGIGEQNEALPIPSTLQILDAGKPHHSAHHRHLFDDVCVPLPHRRNDGRLQLPSHLDWLRSRRQPPVCLCCLDRDPLHRESGVDLVRAQTQTDQTGIQHQQRTELGLVHLDQLHYLLCRRMAICHHYSFQQFEYRMEVERMLRTLSVCILLRNHCGVAFISFVSFSTAKCAIVR
mmetsp:Transcript_32855/g.52606  ORF Transcript_32855/g.52606 Transcript_32855/m.52606 type:complete len:206 (-) Transcript_32855:870-1487(-)